MRAVSVLASLAFLVASWVSAADWCRWRGPNRDGISTETDWTWKWPTEGPPVLWRTPVGLGGSSVTVADGRAFTMGNFQTDAGDEDRILCLNSETGQVLWAHTYVQPKEAAGYEGGPCITPCVDGEHVYTANKRGRVWCLEAATGKVIWDTNPEEKIGRQQNDGGHTPSPFVAGDLLLTGSAALDKATGRKVWEVKTGSRWASPTLFERAGKKHVLHFNAGKLTALHLADGREAWSFALGPGTSMADPLIDGDRIFISHRPLIERLKEKCAVIEVKDDGPTLVWKNAELGSYFQVRILWKGFIYGCDERGLKCVDFQTGELKWTKAGFAMGQVIGAGGKLLMVGGGVLAVAELSPEDYREVARFKIKPGYTPAPPVLANGRLYIRLKGEVTCYDVRTK